MSSAVPEVIALAGPRELAARTARLLEQLLADALAARGVAHLALSGGSTPVAVYEQLAPARWEGVELWYGDERCVGPADPLSNHAMVARTLLDHAPGAREHRVAGELGPDAAAADYATRLCRGIPARERELPVLDVALLGIGEDGHTASLFPDDPALAERDAVCVAVHQAPKPPPERVSLSLGTLAVARRLVLIASGEGKAAALSAALSGTRELAVPATLLERERLTVLCDSAALGER